MSVPLTGSAVRLRAGIDALAVQSGTRIDRALDVASDGLRSGRRRQTARPVVVLLSDGSQNGDVEPVAEDRLLGGGVAVFTIGLGPDVRWAGSWVLHFRRRRGRARGGAGNAVGAVDAAVGGA